MKWEEELPECIKIFMNTSWYLFFERIIGFNVEVSLEFTRNFRGTHVNFASMRFEVLEASIIEATWFSTKGDRWLKKFPFEVDLNLFLLLGNESLDWSNGIHHNSLKD